MAASNRQSRTLAIKLSRERRAGKEIPPPPKGRYSERTRKKPFAIWETTSGGNGYGPDG